MDPDKCWVRGTIKEIMEADGKHKFSVQVGADLKPVTWEKDGPVRKCGEIIKDQACPMVGGHAPSKMVRVSFAPTDVKLDAS